MKNKRGLSNVLKSLSLVIWACVIVAGGMSCLIPSALWAEEGAGGGRVTYERIEKSECTPLVGEKELDSEQPKDTQQHGQTMTGSFVDHRNRTYSTETPGMSSKVPGGGASLGLAYENGEWMLGSARSSLNGFSSESSGLQFHEVCQEYDTPMITAIIKDGKFG
ncbi:MAG: hypothetical protein GY792_05695, partial [Gammaproteobacteria bacterium]|nr:hypothetical protein [Gammaproteobacteria bacterium]